MIPSWQHEAKVTHRPIDQVHRPEALREYDRFVVEEMARVANLRAARQQRHPWRTVFGVCLVIGLSICAVLAVGWALVEAYAP